METFIVYGLNNATRELDETKILTFGPLALALSRILFETETNRPYILEETII